MARILFALLEVFCGAVVLLPVYFLLNKVVFHNGRKTALYFLFSCYLAAVWALVGLPNVTYVRLELNLNAVPFLGMIGDLKNSILNVLLFVPLGFLLPVLWEKYRTWKKTVLFGLGMSLVIEVLQIFTFRATDINDLITNVFGTFLGSALAGVLLNRVPGIRREERSGELVIVCGITFAVMFFAHPFLSGLMWKLIL